MNRSTWSSCSLLLVAWGLEQWLFQTFSFHCGLLELHDVLHRLEKGSHASADLQLSCGRALIAHCEIGAEALDRKIVRQPFVISL